MIHHVVRLKPSASPAPASFRSILLDAAARAYVRIRAYTDSSALPKEGSNPSTYAREVESTSVRRERKGNVPQLWRRRDDFVQGSSTTSYAAVKTRATATSSAPNATVSEGSECPAPVQVSSTPRFKTCTHDLEDPSETTTGTAVVPMHVRRRPFTRGDIYTDHPASWPEGWQAHGSRLEPYDFPLHDAPFVSLQPLGPVHMQKHIPGTSVTTRAVIPKSIRVSKYLKTQTSRRILPDPPENGAGLYVSACPPIRLFTPHDMSMDDPAHSPAQTWTWASEPTPSDFPLHDAPLVSVQPLVSRRVPMPGGPAPTTSRNMLKERMLHLYANPPRDGRRSSLSRLVAFHRSVPRHLHSTWSYNFLVAAHIRFGLYGRADRLLKELRARGIPANVETWKLRVRLLVRRGKWPEAWRSVRNVREDYMGMRLGAQGVPVAVWAELLGTPARGAMRILKGGSRKRVLTKVDAGMADPARYAMVMRIREEMVKDAGDAPSGRVVFMVMRSLLRMGARSAARSLTLLFVKEDPEGLGRRLVNAYVGPWDKKRGLATYYKTMRDLDEFLTACPALRLDGTTLFRLLGHLAGAQRGRTGRAMRLVDWFRRRWGARVVTGRVQRRVLFLAGEEGREDVVEDMMAGWQQRRHARYLWTVEKEVTGGSLLRGRGRLERPREWKVYSGQGTEERRMRRMVSLVRQRSRAMELFD